MNATGQCQGQRGLETQSQENVGHLGKNQAPAIKRKHQLENDGLFYKAVVMSVLLHSAETWALTDAQLSQLSFHYRAAMSICRMYPKKIGLQRNHHTGEMDEVWEWPPTTVVLEKCGLETIDTYLKRRKDKLMNWAKAEIPEQYEACQASRPQALNWDQCVWWDQPNQDNDMTDA